jgi:4-amino-4-deoxy-L-arabinose transferase-like glycosyltransferase
LLFLIDYLSVMRNRLFIQNIPFWIFSIGFIAAMFLPRLVQKGLYCDGLTYASIARNMSLGIGSFWEPYFSSSMWLTHNTGSVFYEHMPLQFWLQSFFFKLFDDHWYVEKIYSLFALVLILWLIVKIWKLVFQLHDTAYRA